MTSSVRTAGHGVGSWPPIPGMVRAAIALAGIALIPSPLAAQAQVQPVGIFSKGPVTLSVTVPNGRGLADILKQIQSLFLTPITYEELPYENARDLPTVTVVKDSGPTKVVVNPVTDFSVTLTESDSSAYLAVQSAMAEYRNAGRPGTYLVTQQGGRVDVIPSQVLAANGSTRNVVSVMGQLVTLPAATRSVADTLQLVADALSGASRFNVVIIGPHFSPFETVELGAVSEPARDLISDIGAATKRPLSFQCLYDPGTKTYYLNVMAVVAPPVPGGPPVHGYVKPQPTLGPSNSPFFTKAVRWGLLGPAPV